MSDRVSLRGMTWSHPRGYDPLVACAAIWKARAGVDVQWDKRSLQDFESFPVGELARQYDLIVIDHPHVGQIIDEDCLLPLDVPKRGDEAAALATASVGRSWQSYTWRDRQWALPIDAAAQVQAWRPDLIAEPATAWDEVMKLAGAGRVLCPLRPPHSLMSFFTLAANLGTPCAADGPGPLIERSEGAAAWRHLADLAGAVDPRSYDMDPIAVLGEMARADTTIACAPLIYGYVSYARDGFRASRIAFADIPAAGRNGPVGSALGGTGIAVSARNAHPEEAMAFAYFVAGEEAQRGPYAEAGGQPGHAAAWEDDLVNARTHDFFRNTRRTLEGAWVRPRHGGYMRFQDAASRAINDALRSRSEGGAVIDALNRMFEESFP